MLGLPAPIKGLRIVPHRPLVLLTTTMCPKRRPPRPKHPKFTHFHRSGLRFGRFPAQHRSIGGVGGCRSAWLRRPWAVAGPGRASRSTTPSRRLACGDLAGGPPPTSTHSGQARRHPDHQRNHVVAMGGIEPPSPRGGRRSGGATSSAITVARHSKRGRHQPTPCASALTHP